MTAARSYSTCFILWDEARTRGERGRYRLEVDGGRGQVRRRAVC